MMLDEQIENGVTPAGEPQTSAPAESVKRERSTIEFPYGDLDYATAVATAIYENAGPSCTLNQLASYLNNSPTSSAVRTQIACARTFGLLERDGSQVRLTELGKRIADKATTDDAKVAAFLHVPLFAALHQDFDGYNLPPAAALQRKMQELGVASKQTERARQIFERSARQAGFIAQGSGRFVMPASRGGITRHGAQSGGDTDAAQGPPQRGGGGGSGPGGGERHPFITGLLKTLPEPETEWTTAARVKWLRAASHIFDVIYSGDGSIKIEEEKAAD